MAFMSMATLDPGGICTSNHRGVPTLELKQPTKCVNLFAKLISNMRIELEYFMRC